MKLENKIKFLQKKQTIRTKVMYIFIFHAITQRLSKLKLSNFP